MQLVVKYVWSPGPYGTARKQSPKRQRGVNLGGPVRQAELTCPRAPLTILRLVFGSKGTRIARRSGWRLRT